MPRAAPVELPYLWTPKFRGRVYLYYRRGAVRVRLPAKDTPGFLAAYAAAHALADQPGISKHPAGSVGALIAAYRASPEWTGLADASRKDYQKALRPLELRAGHMPVATMPREFVFRLRDDFAVKTVVVDGTSTMVATPRRANRMVNVLRILLGWAYDRGMVKQNVALRPGRLATGPGYTAWTAEAFAQFMASADEPLRRAAALGFYTGMRKQDCLAMTWGQRQDGAITNTPAKTLKSTGVVLVIPEHPALTAVLDLAPRTCLRVLTRANGKPWKEDHFNHSFAGAVKAAGLVGLSFHGLRKAASVILAEGGATDAELGAVLGHMDPRMVKLYRAQADQRALAKSGMAKRV